MANLETSFIGMKLKSPVIVGSSGLTDSVEKIKKIEKFGAGAVILKSLFEEQIEFESGKILAKGNSEYPEAEDYVRNYVKNNSISDYLKLIEGAKKEVKIPVIASINCVTGEDWTGFATKIQNAGADALELNINIVPVDQNNPSMHYENIYYKIFEKVKAKTTLPIIIKMGYNFTNILYLINQLQYRGLKAVTLFNKFYEPDINIREMKLISSEIFSCPADIRLVLRWIGLVSDKVNDIQISGSTGVHSGEAAIKMILAGASTLQVCSSLYKNGLEFLSKINSEISDWMDQYNFKKMSDFSGLLNYSKIDNPLTYERSQFMKYFSSVH
ncbi:MAG: dihydroorotate dehydrogenase-like protein [Bacteroidota bacterium]